MHKRLKLIHFRLIAEIARAGQLSAAAEQLGMTQPAASRILSDIELIVGARLFERVAKGMEATPIGAELANRAVGLNAEVEDIVRAVGDAKQGRHGRVRIGAVTSAAVVHVVDAIGLLRAELGAVDIYVDCQPSGQLIERLLARDLDFVLGRLPATVDPRQFESHLQRREPLDFCVRPSHPLAARDRITLADLQQYPMVVQTSGSPIRIAIEHSMAELGVAMPEDFIDTSSMLTALAVMAKSDAVAPLTRGVRRVLTESEIGARLHVLDTGVEISIWPYSLLTLRGRILSPLAERTIALLTRLIAGAEG